MDVPRSFHQSNPKISTYFDIFSRNYHRRKSKIKQAYNFISAAQRKLLIEASRPNQELRLLVGHANLVDSLTKYLTDIEIREQDWFNDLPRSTAIVEDFNKNSDAGDLDTGGSDTEDSDTEDSDTEDSDTEDSDTEDSYTGYSDTGYSCDPQSVISDRCESQLSL
ncbi:hypothetical protein N7510_008929 [Penicillium lagena]|uniref:uncharacterized protein n=1 Tax=Penicillium lagena TaxID=94218 RepID=UPI002541BE90|nr:uncharacterized protein N7510_008929 [Penicillium lagena]KAJ5606148.1 hypothetical protein N7510_008929 [Penicillium lagena]